MSLVIIERHYTVNQSGTEIIGGGWIFFCPGCRQKHYIQTMTAALPSRWELLIHGPFGEKVSFRRKGAVDLTQACIFSLTDNKLIFDIRSKHALKGTSIPFYVSR